MILQENIINGMTMKKMIPRKIKNYYHLLMAMAANYWYGFPSRKIKIIGITGTNGKTTTTQMVAKILEQAGFKVAMSSTINFKIAEKEWVNKTKFTTLSAWQVQQFIAQAVKENCDYAVLETSSHALDQNRVWGVAYDVAVITNVTREHLDYHKTMEEYRLAKKRLFDALGRVRKPSVKKTSVINGDMQQPEEYYLAKSDETYLYQVDPDDENLAHPAKEDHIHHIIARDIQYGLDGTSFILENQTFQLQLIGRFNVENALAAICVGLSQKVSLATMAEALGKIEKIPGRMDRVANNRGIDIIIDYAVTPDSLEKIGQLIKPIDQEGKRRIVWVFGSCGERDRGKRPIMGKIVAQYADYVLVTNEDPYNEDPQQIIDEVYAGVLDSKQDGVNCWQVMDRKEAIKKAIEIAGQDGLVMVTGKGAEETMAIGDRQVPWNDKKVIEEILKSLPNG